MDGWPKPLYQCNPHKKCIATSALLSHIPSQSEEKTRALAAGKSSACLHETGGDCILLAAVKKNILSSFLRALSKGAYHIILGLGPVEASLGSNTKTCWSVIVISRPVLCQRIILAFMIYALRDYARRVQWRSVGKNTHAL